MIPVLHWKIGLSVGNSVQHGQTVGVIWGALCRGEWIELAATDLDLLLAGLGVCTMSDRESGNEQSQVVQRGVHHFCKPASLYVATPIQDHSPRQGLSVGHERSAEAGILPLRRSNESYTRILSPRCVTFRFATTATGFRWQDLHAHSNDSIGFQQLSFSDHNSTFFF